MFTYVRLVLLCLVLLVAALVDRDPPPPPPTTSQNRGVNWRLVAGTVMFVFSALVGIWLGLNAFTGLRETDTVLATTAGAAALAAFVQAVGESNLDAKLKDVIKLAGLSLAFAAASGAFLGALLPDDPTVRCISDTGEPITCTVIVEN